MKPATAKFAFRLMQRGRMNSDDQEQFIDATSEEEVAELADKLYRNGKITMNEHDGLVYAARSDILRRADGRRKAKFNEIDRSLGCRRASPEVQGGLPSLGKGR
jgi:hypothetical protein